MMKHSVFHRIWQTSVQTVITYGKFDFLGDQCEVVYLERTPEISTTQIKSDLGK